jgi:hypothetical protein
VLEAAGLVVDRHRHGYGSARGHSVTIGASWPEVIATLGGTSLSAAVVLRNLLTQLWNVSEESWGTLDEIDLIDFDRTIWLIFHKPDLGVSGSEWERLVLTPLVELQSDGPEASTVISHRSGVGWGRVARTSGTA